MSNKGFSLAIPTIVIGRKRRSGSGFDELYDSSPSSSPVRRTKSLLPTEKKFKPRELKKKANSLPLISTGKTLILGNRLRANSCPDDLIEMNKNEREIIPLHKKPTTPTARRSSKDKSFATLHKMIYKGNFSNFMPNDKEDL
jgi:hypothetical protein